MSIINDRANRTELVSNSLHVFVVFVLNTTNIEHIVASNERLAQIASQRAVDVLFGVGQLQVHVAVD